VAGGGGEAQVTGALVKAVIKMAEASRAVTETRIDHAGLPS
jgi:hypothetical protein